MKIAFLAITVAIATSFNALAQQFPTGYTDTPTIPGSKWRVHDDARPRPPVISPGSCSTAGDPNKPPSDAVSMATFLDGDSVSGGQVS